MLCVKKILPLEVWEEAVKAFDSSLVALKGVRWRDALSRIAFPASVPARRWPMHWHLALAAVLVCSVCGTAVYLMQAQIRRHSEAVAQLQHDQAALRTASLERRPANAESLPELADPRAIEKILRDF